MYFVNGLHFNNLRGDVFGGLTAAVVALPLALAFGVSSGAGPIAGLYGAIFVGLFAAIFGGTGAQVSGPTGPMTVVMAAIFTQYTALDPVNGAAIAFTVVIMGGLLQILFGILRIGHYINYVPLPVISGFMSGIGVIIIILQLAPLLGQAASGGPLAALQALPEAFTNLNSAALLLGVITLGVVYLTPRKVNKYFPAPLLALVVGTLLLLLFFQGQDITILGEIPTGLPAFRLPHIELTLLPSMLKSALILALLGTIDSLLTSLVADNITNTYHRSNRELIGQGIGNTLAGFFGGLPGAGATMRTVVNVRAGGLTPISGALHALVLLSIVLGLGGVAKHIPHVVLAGILIKVGTDIIDWDYLKRILRTGHSGVIIMFTVLFTTVFVDLIIAVAIGMTMAAIMLLKRQTDLQLSKMRFLRGKDEASPLDAEGQEIMQKAEGRILLYHIGGPVSFGAAKEMQRMQSFQVNYDVLVLDLHDVSAIDYTASCAIKDIINNTHSNNRKVIVVLPCGAVARMLDQERVLDDLQMSFRHIKRLNALRHAQKLLA